MAATDPATSASAAAAVLRDLPPALWDQVVEMFRAALPRLLPSELPPAVRPFASWHPEKLGRPRARAAIAEAVVGDARLHAAMAQAHAEQPGGDRAAAALVADARWSDLLVLSGTVSDELAARDTAAADAARSRDEADARRARDRLEAEVRRLRQDRDAARARAEGAMARAAAAEEALDRTSAEVAALRDRLADMERERTDERRRAGQRLGRQRRRTEEAEARTRIDAARAAAVADRLDELSAELRAALGQAPSPRAEAGGSETAVAVPRQVPPAAPGRPCTLPAGLTTAHAAGVVALLRAPGMMVVVDGYNVSKSPRGRPLAALADQRQWLVRTVETVAVRHGCRAVLVFDGTDEAVAPAPASRVVTTLFSSGGELADDRIVSIIESRDAQAPIVVVTSDRELAERCAARAADTVGAAAFLEAVRA